MNKSTGIIPLAFLLALVGIKGVEAQETFTVRNNEHNASFLFRVYSDADLSTGHGFSLQREGRTPYTEYMPRFLPAGDTAGFLIELPDGQYKVKPIGLGNTSSFEVNLDPMSVDVGDDFLIYEGKTVYGRGINLFLDNIERKELVFRFSCPREIAFSAKEVVFKTENGVERYPVSERGEDYFQADVPVSMEKGRYKGLEILVNNGNGLREADVTVGDWDVQSKGLVTTNLRSNKSSMSVKVLLNDPQKSEFQHFSEVYFIKNPGREISPSEFDKFLFENVNEIPPGQYIVEAIRGNEIYRRKFNVASAGTGPSYISSSEKDIFDSEGQCNLVFSSEDRVYDRLYQKIREQVATNLYNSGSLEVGSGTGLSKRFPITFKGKDYDFGFRFTRGNNSLALEWDIDKKPRIVFDLSKDEVLSMAKTESQDDNIRKDYFSISRISQISPFRLSVEGYTYFKYLSNPIGKYINRQLSKPFEDQNFYFILKLQQEGSGTDISHYFEE